MSEDEELRAELGRAARARAAKVERELEEAAEHLRQLEDAAPRRPAANAAITARLASQLGALAPVAPPARVGPPPRGKVVQLRPATMAGVMTVVAMVAGGLLWFRGVGAPLDAGPVPAYRLIAQAGLSEMRGAAPSGPAVSDLKLTRDQELVLVARPADEVRGPVDARAFVRSGGHDVAWPGAVQMAPSGAVQLVAAVRDLVAPGATAFDAEVVVDRPGALPQSFDAAHASPRAMHLHVDVVEGAGGTGH